MPTQSGLSSAVFVLDALTIVCFAAVNQIVPRPYLDEIFHIPQAQAYCDNKFDVWDPAITTPPGLYILARLYSAMLSPIVGSRNACSPMMLRSLNVVVFVFILPKALSLLAGPSSSATGRRRRDSEILRFAPPLYFFTFLFYTDMVASLLALLSVGLARAYPSYTPSSASWVVVIAKCAVGMLAISTRQTNIVWVAYAFASELLDGFVYCGDNASPVETTVHNLSSLLSVPLLFVRCLKPALVRLYSRVFATPGGIRDITRVLFAYTPVLVSFALFVHVNGGITLGDKANHIPALHIVQLLYFAVFACIMQAPVLLLRRNAGDMIVTRSLRALATHPVQSVLALVAVLWTISKFTIVHAFILADNRHYTFYINRRVLNVTPWARFALAPGYLLCLRAALIERAAPRARVLDSVLFWGAAAAVLVPSPLIECRYFIVPYFVWRSSAMIEGSSDTDRSDGETAKTRETARWAELAWYAMINAATVALFLLVSFEWPSEPGEKQRFMW
ncbi:alpha-2-glucosyltransferase Alg10 [Limtongia smithiae]|uniref:alpha-2-glucosyltransferase Alg10 n=1 Tax=Limtongia smithiae TaxID=1125753 RepID=UPI0034CEE958